jgi:hypothetical protein
MPISQCSLLDTSGLEHGLAGRGPRRFFWYGALFPGGSALTRLFGVGTSLKHACGNHCRRPLRHCLHYSRLPLRRNGSSPSRTSAVWNFISGFFFATFLVAISRAIGKTCFARIRARRDPGDDQRGEIRIGEIHELFNQSIGLEGCRQLSARRLNTSTSWSPVHGMCAAMADP